jgi:hypothetical protein
MKKFLIEVPHEAEPAACIRAIKILQETGSHYLTNADYGCLDGVHKAWIVVEVDDKEQARNILPRLYRDQATIVALNKFTPEDIEELLEHHQG